MMLYLRKMYCAKDQGFGRWNLILYIVSFLIEDKGLFSAPATIILNCMDLEYI